MAELLLKDLVLDEEIITKGGKVELIDVKPWKEFDNVNKRTTDTVLGTKYECSLPQFLRRTFMVKVPTGFDAISVEKFNQIIQDSGEFPLVGFRKLSGSVYNKNGQQVITCKAEEIFIVPNQVEVGV